jgi:hypothetical protein
VEAGDVAGFETAMRNAFEPFQGQLLLAKGWQIADGATVKSQIRVSYRTIQDPAEIIRQQQASASKYADVKQVVEHHLTGAMTDPATLDRGTPYLIMSDDGRVLKSGYLPKGLTTANLPALQEQVPGQPLKAISIMPRFLPMKSRDSGLLIAWVQP